MRRQAIHCLGLCLVLMGTARAADVVPTDIQQPGTQPREIGNLETPDKCDNCHGGYHQTVEPAHNWRGSMMANAGHDPIFWATLAVAEHDLHGAGDLCIRCHSTSGWIAGRSTPSDGSGLAAGDYVMTWSRPRRQAPGTYAANVVDVIKNGYAFDPSGSVTSVTFFIQ